MSVRKAVLLLGIVAVLGVGGYAASRSMWLRAWFARDSEDAGEIAKLGEKKLDVTPAADTAAGWFQWRGPTRDGRAPVGPFRTDWDKNPPKLLWTAGCGGGFSSCAVVGGRVYTQDFKDGNERVICLDAETGKPVWEYAYPADYAGTDRSFAIGPRATPAVVGGRVYAVGGAGKLLCLEPPAAAGVPARVVWQHDLLPEFDAKIPQWGVACSPLVEGDLVVVQPGGKKGTVAAFDRASGELRWAIGTDPSGYSSPVAGTVGGLRMLFVLTGENLLAVGLNGTIYDGYAWKTDHKGNIATPLVADDYVFISSAYGMGCALLRAEAQGDGVKLVPVYARRGRAFQNHHATSVLKGRHLFGFDGMGSARLKCVNLDTGKEKEDWEADGVGKGSVMLSGDHLVIQTERGELCLVEATPDEFRLVAKLPKVLSGNNNWATPVLADGRLFLRDETKVVCYDVRP